jgi:transposase InsO family protein
MTVASFVAAQRAEHGVPHALSCRALGVSQSWFYKWRDRPPTARQCRRAEIDAMVKNIFDASGGTYGSPRVFGELRDGGEAVSKKTVEASMARQGLVARPGPRRGHWLTRQAKKAVPAADLLCRDFTAEAINVKWSGDLTEIPTREGKLYLAVVEDLASRRALGFAIGEHHDAALAAAAIKMAVTVRGGDVRGVTFHSDRGSEFTATSFAKICERFGITQSMGRVGSALDNAASESFFSTLEFEVLAKNHFRSKVEARRVVASWIDRFYNRVRRHSYCGGRCPVDFEAHLAANTALPPRAA